MDVAAFALSWPCLAGNFAAAMPAKATRLRESHEAAPPSAKVIDAEFAIVRGRRGWAAKLTLALAATALAALAGMLIPPLVVAVRAMSDTL